MNRLTCWALVLTIIALLFYGAGEFVIHTRWWVTGLVAIALVGLAFYRERPHYISGHADGDAP